MTQINSKYERALKECPLISVNPEIQAGHPCIKGTRIPVHCVLHSLRNNRSIAGVIFESYPALSEEQIEQALYFAEILIGGNDD